MNVCEDRTGSDGGDSAFELGSQEGKHCLDQVTQEMSALLKRLGAWGGWVKVRENDM